MRASVIIPYYERVDHLQKTLEALSNQSMSLSDYEIIVVDDGSSQSIEPLMPDPVRLIRSPHRGAAAARNNGISVAKGEIVIFLDSDMVVDPWFIETHCHFHDNHPKSVGLGLRLHMDASGSKQTTDTRLKLLNRYGKTVSNLRHPWFMTYTCNVSVSRELILNQLFDENYIDWGLEDSEWAYRLYCQGFDFMFIEKATAIHLYHDRTMTHKKFQGWQKNLAYTVAKHPKLVILEPFIDVFNPEKQADYFKSYDAFEEISTPIS